jgi:hypothetical protein
MRRVLEMQMVPLLLSTNRPALKTRGGQYQMKYSREVISFNYDGVVLWQLVQKAVWRVPGWRGDWIHGTQPTSHSKTWGRSVLEELFTRNFSWLEELS